ncbi:hypothetical protein CI109_105907 [Kwoniella shandongensis]|uniref:MaoC-like domain-containing protein n=1 Tax=Kwoniella shandongensis TaxID=1734106 RepID=A0AAJ8LP28_9TREE
MVPAIGLLLLTALTWIIHWTGVTALYPLLSGSSATSIPFPNTELQGARFWIVFVYVLVSSFYRRVTGRPGVRVSTSSDEAIHQLVGPTSSLVMPFRISQDDIDKYTRAVSSTHPVTPDQIFTPPHLHLLLCALVQPPMLLLLSKRTSPVDAVGSVNVRNRFELPNPSLCARRIHEELGSPGDRGGRLSLHARLDKNVKRMKRGWESCVIIDLLDGSGKGDKSVLYRQIFTFLQFHKHRIPPPSTGTQSMTDAAATTQVASLSLSTEDPRRWAALCKDYNPIHISSLAAKLFGFRSSIAHGNHVAAKTVAMYEQQNSSASHGAQGSKQEGESWMEVEFLRPTFLPCNLQVRNIDNGKAGTKQLQIGRADKVNVGVKYSV